MIAEKMKPFRTEQFCNPYDVRRRKPSPGDVRMRTNVFDFSLGNPSVPAPDCVRRGHHRSGKQRRTDCPSWIYEQCRVRGCSTDDCTVSEPSISALLLLQII